MRALSARIAAGLAARGVRPGDKVAILSANDPVAFTCVFGISRAGAVWCPINPRNEAAENRDLLDLFDCEVLIFQAQFAPLVERSAATCRACTRWSASTATSDGSLGWDEFLAAGDGVVGSTATRSTTSR